MSRACGERGILYKQQTTGLLGKNCSWCYDEIYDLLARLGVLGDRETLSNHHDLAVLVKPPWHVQQ